MNAVEYRAIEKQVMPMIRRRAARLRSVMDPDDAIQEARIVLLKALQSYDADRTPDLRRYVSVCLNNAFNTLYRKETAKCRMPYVYTPSNNGWKAVPARPDELDESLVNSYMATPEDTAIHRESEGRISQLTSRIEASLELRDRAVLYAFLSPPPGLSNPPTNQEVADYLGLSKNMLDWSLHKIRKAMLAELRRGPASDTFLPMVTGHGWPHISHSDVPDDTDMIVSTIWDRELSQEVIAHEERAKGDAVYKSWTFRWGTVLVLRLGTRAATIVMVGRFNASNGLLFGTVCGCESIPVPWYSDVLKAVGNGT